MKSSRKTEEPALRFLAAACYLISAALCGLAAHALARLTLSATGEFMRGLYPPFGQF